MPFRTLLAFFSFCLTMLLYVDRICISTAKDAINTEFGLSKIQFGWVLAVFTLGYALFQAPSGKLADKFGARIVISSIVAIWSALTALTGATVGFISLLVMRFLFGAGEAGAFPALSKVVFKWFPNKERGLVQGINFSGSRIGAAVALPFVVSLVAALGWRHTFLVLGVFGICFATLWYWLFRNSPEESTFVSEKEKKHIMETRQQPAKSLVQLTTGEILTSKNVWLAMTQYTCSNFTFYFSLTWMFIYIKEQFSVDAATAAKYGMIPLLAGAAGNIASGLIVDITFKSGNLSLSRKLPAILGFLISGFGMFMVAKAPSLEMAVLYMSLAVFGADMTLSPSWAFCIDIARQSSGVVSGFMNMAGNLGAFVTTLAFLYLSEWSGGSKVPFFYTCAALSVIAAVAWMQMNPHKAIKES